MYVLFFYILIIQVIFFTNLTKFANRQVKPPNHVARYPFRTIDFHDLTTTVYHYEMG